MAGKNYKAAAKLANRTQHHEIGAAVAILKKMHYAKFDEGVDVAVRLGVDPKHADQMVRGAVSLPHGIGKTIRVIVFAKGDKVAEAREAGADEVGGPELVEKIKGGWLDFDKAVATPDMMGQVGRLGRVLGPRGLMPNPKVGTVTPDVATAVQNAKAGQVRYRTDKSGIIHCQIGTVGFEVEALTQNLEALLTDLNKAKPAASKGQYMQRVSVSSTMGPGVIVDQATVSA
jgi:large subunit ribosomal protein L1